MFLLFVARLGISLLLLASSARCPAADAVAGMSCMCASFRPCLSPRTLLFGVAFSEGWRGVVGVRILMFTHAREAMCVSLRPDDSLPEVCWGGGICNANN